MTNFTPMKSGWSSASPIKPGRQAVFTISDIEDELLDSRAMVNYCGTNGVRDLFRNFKRGNVGSRRCQTLAMCCDARDTDIPNPPIFTMG
jgi:hypothetical protein